MKGSFCFNCDDKAAHQLRLFPALIGGKDRKVPLCSYCYNHLGLVLEIFLERVKERIRQQTYFIRESGYDPHREIYVTIPSLKIKIKHNHYIRTSQKNKVLAFKERELQKLSKAERLLSKEIRKGALNENKNNKRN